MKKKKLLKILIPSIIAGVLVIGGIITAVLLLRPKKFGDSEVFSEIASRLYANNAALAESYNNKDDNFSSAPVFGSGMPNGLEVYEGEDSFESYVKDANLVMGYYAISEYLNEQDGIKMEKTYNYSSSTVQYYAIASSSSNEFSFKLMNSQEKIEVIINYKKEKKETIPLSIEFYQQQNYTGSFVYLSAIIDFEKSAYEQVSFTTNSSELPMNITAANAQNNFSKFSYFYVDYNDFSKFEGYDVKNFGYEYSEEVGEKVAAYFKNYKKNLSFKNFENKFNQRKAIDFPNPEDLQVYAFNKYEVSLEKNEDGKLVLLTSRKNGMNEDVLDALNSYNKFTVPEIFESLNYTVEGVDTKIDHKTLYPSISAINSNIQNWIKNEYDKDAYYYKTIENEEYQILIYANKFMYSEFYENEAKLVSVNSFDDDSWKFKYYQSNNTSSFLYTISKSTSSYKVGEIEYFAEEYYFQKSEYDLKYSDLSFEGTYYTMKSFDSVLYRVEKDKEGNVVNVKYVYENKKETDVEITEFEILKTGNQELVGRKSKYAINENYFDSINEEIKRFTENAAGESQERADVGFTWGGLDIHFWRNKVSWDSPGSDPIETKYFKLVKDGKVLVSKKPLRGQYSHNFKGGIYEFYFTFTHKGVEKFSYIKFKIDGKYDWDKISIVDSKFNYTLTNGDVKFDVSETGVKWELLNGVALIEQGFNKNSTGYQTMDASKKSMTLDEMYNGSWGSSISVRVKYDGEFGEQFATVNLASTYVTYLKPTARNVFTGISGSFTDSISGMGLNYKYTVGTRESNDNYSADLFVFVNKISFILLKDTKREIFYRENAEDLSEFTESEKIRVLAPNVESAPIELNVGLYQIRYTGEQGLVRVLNMVIKKVEGKKTIEIYHPE